MLDGLVRAALRQRLIVVVIALALLAFGLQAARRLSVDAFPDVTNVQVQIATEARRLARGGRAGRDRAAWKSR